MVRDLGTRILRGDKVGIIGPNGVGKSTLLKLLLGERAPDTGHIRLGTNLEIAYFDQLRAGLEAHKSVQDNVVGGRDKVVVLGHEKHVIPYSERLSVHCRPGPPTDTSSIRRRTQPAITGQAIHPTRQSLGHGRAHQRPGRGNTGATRRAADRFQRDLAAVSHDRALLNAVMTGTLAFEGMGAVRKYVGGHDDWLRQRPPIPTVPPTPKPEHPEPRSRKSQVEAVLRKLSYKDQRELEDLPARIESLEAEQAALHEHLTDPAFYRQAGSAIASVKERLANLEDELERAYARWQALKER